MKYVVINVCDREIKKVGVTSTSAEAIEIMKNDFMNVFTKHYNKVDFENEVDRCNEWNLYEKDAWLHTNSDHNYDWTIIEVE